MAIWLYKYMKAILQFYDGQDDAMGAGISLVHFQVFRVSFVSGPQAGCRKTGKPGVDDAMNIQAAIEKYCWLPTITG